MRTLSACLLALVALPALAEPPAAEEPALAGLEPLTSRELGGLRGGLLFAGGFAFDFGAIVRTAIDGEPALETRLTWTRHGPVIEDLSAISGAPLSEFGGFGISIVDASGTTLVGHRLYDGQIQNYIVNNGDNRTIRQDLDITLTLPGFAEVQRGMLGDRLNFRLGLDVADAIVRSSLQ
jgi:hypothetical protein